jgi:hypothetical protein
MFFGEEGWRHREKKKVEFAAGVSCKVLYDEEAELLIIDTSDGDDKERERRSRLPFGVSHFIYFFSFLFLVLLRVAGSDSINSSPAHVVTNHHRHHPSTRKKRREIKA